MADRRVKGKGGMEKQKRTYSLNQNAFAYLRVHHPSLLIQTACPWESRVLSRLREQWNVLFTISTLLVQFASHKGLSPPADKELSLKHKYNIMGMSSLLTGESPNPAGSQEHCHLATAAGCRLQVECSARQLGGSGFEPRLHHLLTVEPWLRSQSLLFSSRKGQFLY